MTNEEKIWLNDKKLDLDDWWNISRFGKLTEEFMDAAWDKLNHWDVSGRQELSEDFMRRHKDDLQWFAISANQKMSEDFMIEFADYIKWGSMICNNCIPFEIIRGFSDILNQEAWTQLSYKRNITINEIREWMDKLDWKILYDIVPQIFVKTNEFDEYLKKAGVLR